jgi:type 1 glutamine amidotransferase
MGVMATDSLSSLDVLPSGSASLGSSERTSIVEDYAKAWEKQLISQNKANLSKAQESEEKSEKEIADASKAFLQAKAKRIAASVNAAPTTKAAANEMQALQAFMGGGGGGIPSTSVDAPSTTSDASSTVGDPSAVLQGNFENIQFTSDSASQSPLSDDPLSDDRSRNPFPRR